MEDLIPTPAVFAGSLARTFEYRTAGVHSAPQVRWTFPTSGAISCPVLSDQGVMYVADTQGSYSAIEATSGDLLWRFQDDNANSVSAVCLDETTCYLGFDVGEEADVPMLVELDLETGELRRSWTSRQCVDETNLDNFDPDMGVSVEHLMIKEDLIITSAYGPIMVLHRSTGTVKQSNECLTGWNSGVAPTVAQNRLYGFLIYSNSGDFEFHTYRLFWEKQKGEEVVVPAWFSWDPEAGEHDLERRTPITLLMTQNTPIMDETLFVVGRCVDDRWGDDEYSLLALDSLTGEPLWRYRLPERDNDTHATLVAAYGLVYLQAQDWIEAIDMQTHLPRWTWQGRVTLLHAFVADSLLYIFDEQGQITALDAHTGEQRWIWQMEGDMLGKWQTSDSSIKREWAVFSTIADGTLYVVVGDTLYALR